MAPWPSQNGKIQPTTRGAEGLGHLQNEGSDLNLTLELPQTTAQESGQELEFRLAMQEYKRKSGRLFPTWSEVLEVLRGLGYRKEPSLAGPADSSVEPHG